MIPIDLPPLKKCYGDTAIIHGMSESTIWSLLFTNFGKAVLLIFKQWFKFNSAALCFGQTSVLHVQHGIQNTGIIISLYTFIFMVIWNSVHTHQVIAPLYFLILPYLLLTTEGDIIVQWIFDVKSKALLYYTIVFGFMTLVHIFMAYIGLGNQDITKRGNSLIMIGLGKMLKNTRFKPSEFFVCAFVEPGLILGLGSLFFYQCHDRTFGIFCFLMGGHELVARIKEKSAQLHRQAYLNA